MTDDRARDGDPIRTRTMTQAERQAMQEELRIGRLFGKPLTGWTSGKSCLDCGVALLWERGRGAPRYCGDCAADRGIKQHTATLDKL